MKIAIPLTAGRLSKHFRYCEQFALINAHPAENGIANQITMIPPPHEPRFLSRWLHQQRVRVVIAGRMGQRALGSFTLSGSTVRAVRRRTRWQTCASAERAVSASWTLFWREFRQTCKAYLAQRRSAPQPSKIS
jgi:predicted Fe-Mo cluster-binding NifX family protein